MRDHESLVRHIASQGIQDPRLLEAVRTVRRGDFVPPGSEARAYSDRPVGLPEAQTTSQPSLIAHMIDAAHVGPDDLVLEVGTGYGYQTALLAKVARAVVSIERHATLAEAARENLRRVGIVGAEIKVGDGWNGWIEEAPYDTIIVSAAASTLPQSLADQLAEGGRLVIPLQRGAGDDVYLFVKEGGVLGHGRLVTPARFVPLVPGVPETK